MREKIEFIWTFSEFKINTGVIHDSRPDPLFALANLSIRAHNAQITMGVLVIFSSYFFIALLLLLRKTPSTRQKHSYQR